LENRENQWPELYLPNFKLSDTSKDLIYPKWFEGNWLVTSQDIINDSEAPVNYKVNFFKNASALIVGNRAKNAESENIKVIIAGAGGAAHLPGMLASITCIPVIGVPVESKTLKGIDSLLSIVQMPAGIPVATVAINGGQNAGLLAIEMISLFDESIKKI